MPYDDDDDDESQESGGQLRAKLESALKTNSKLTQQLSGFLAEKLVAEKGFHTVKPEDLAGVELDKLESHASALHADRLKLQGDLLRSAFAAQGYEGDALERLVAGTAESTASALANTRALGKLDGQPVPLVDPRNLSPVEKMEYALKHPKRQRA